MIRASSILSAASALLLVGASLAAAVSELDSDAASSTYVPAPEAEEDTAIFNDALDAFFSRNETRSRIARDRESAQACAGPEDWACLSAVVAAVVAEEFSIVGDRAGVQIESPARYVGAGGGADPSWFTCSTVNFSSFGGLDDPALRELMNTLGIFAGCSFDADAISGVAAGENATCDAIFASIRAMYRLLFAGLHPRFWRYGAVNWYEGGISTPGPAQWQTPTFQATGTILMPRTARFPRMPLEPEEVTFVSWTGSAADVDYDVPAGTAPTVELGDRSAVSGWMLCEMLSTIILQNNNQVSTNSLPRSLTHSLAHSLTHSLTHALAHS